MNRKQVNDTVKKLMSFQEKVVSDILRTFVSERLQMTNVSWRSRSNRPT